MPLQATKNFSASLNGERYSLRKGDSFTGSDYAAAYFKRKGLLRDVVRATKKGASND